MVKIISNKNRFGKIIVKPRLVLFLKHPFMKTAIFLTLFCMLSGYSLFAQTQPNNSAIAQDSILHIIETNLPEGWTMEISKNELIVYRIEKITVIRGDCDSISEDTIEHYRNNETAAFYFKIEDKWSEERMFWTREFNDSLKLRLDMLPQEYGIVHLYDPAKSSRSKSIYSGRTQEEKDKVEAYYKKRAEIASHISRLPNFYSSNFSLFLYRQTGYYSPSVCVFPETASKEANTVYILFLEYCENPLRR